MSNLMAVLLNGIAQLEYDRHDDLPIFHVAYLRKMDKKMDGGITLGDEKIDNPDKDQRAKFVAATLYAAMKDDNLSLSQACTTWLAENLPELKQVKFNDTEGEVEIDLVFDEDYIKQQTVNFPGIDLNK
ncbi:MAG TPA: hypothetical protein EYH06_02150 [Chromatiales bacterium]|nr:hypothetical protein [Thiotrichales bacterium]HIP67375.1 hypothetical protein [Chromatiales bacterium]